MHRKFRRFANDALWPRSPAARPVRKEVLNHLWTLMDQKTLKRIVVKPLRGSNAKARALESVGNIVNLLVESCRILHLLAVAG